MAVRSGRRRNAIAGQFAARPIEVLHSPAYRVLSRAAHLVLSRLEIEHAQHAGKDNGRLPCTYAHFQEYGVHKHTVAAAIRELADLGFIEVTRRGAAGNAEFRQPAHYRITYRPAHDAIGDGTHEYRRIVTMEDAEKIAKQARDNTDSKAVARGKKTKSRPQKVGVNPPPENGGETARIPPPESGVTVLPPESGVTSISRSRAQH